MFYFGETGGKQKGEDDLDDVGQNKWHDADKERVDEGAAHHIDEPSAASEIDQRKGDRRKRIMHPTRDCEEAQNKVKERDRRKRHDEAPRRGQKHREAAAESRKDRQSDRTEQEVQPHRDRPTLAAEVLERKEDAEDLQRERNGRRDRDKRANRIQRNRESDVCDVSRLQFA